VLFFIPQAVWEEKPPGVAGMVNYAIRGGGEVEDLGVGKSTPSGRPISHVTEAYWNYYIPGVILILIAHGWFHRWLANVFVRYANLPVVQLLYIKALGLNFSSGSVKDYQIMVIMIGILFMIGALGVNPKKASTSYTNYSQSNP